MSLRAPVLAAAALVAAALATPPAAGAGTPAERARPAALTTFDSCKDLARYGRRHLRRYHPAVQEDAASGGGSGSSFSTTNVQEAGIDEPDIVKTDGERVFAIAGGKLHAVDVTGGAPRLLDTLAVGGEESWDHQLFLRDHRILLLWSAWQDHRDVTVLAEVDATDPGAMRVARTYAVDGYLLDARMTGTTARVALRSTPGPVHLRREAAMRQRARRWLPKAVLRDRMAGTRTTGRAVGCRAVRRARTFSGLDLVTVVTVDFAGELDVTDTDALMTDAETVYASAGGLYLATAPWLEPTSTTIHRFDTTDPIATSYAGSGVVHGTLLNQFSLSEHDGVLRVASTGGRQSFVTTLRRDPATGGLTEVGRIGGLGLDERIYAVRFIEDVGYVVTFRETDPLYTLDLSDPATPRVVGELKIEGYSAYLHPIGDGKLIGVGQDATRQGRRLGTQVSLFDVSDLAAPRRLARLRLGDDASSEVEWDHHAFLWWPETSLAVVPVWRWDEDREASDSAAVGLRVAPDAIAEVGRAEHPGRDWDAEVRRSLVAGGMLYTLSSGGLMASTLDTLDARAWLPLR
jgi:hypothetical protein